MGVRVNLSWKEIAKKEAHKRGLCIRDINDLFEVYIDYCDPINQAKKYYKEIQSLKQQLKQKDEVLKKLYDELKIADKEIDLEKSKNENQYYLLVQKDELLESLNNKFSEERIREVIEFHLDARQSKKDLIVQDILNKENKG